MQEIIILRHKLTEGLSKGETSEALRSMQDELQRLQIKARLHSEQSAVQLRQIVPGRQRSASCRCLRVANVGDALSGGQ